MADSIIGILVLALFVGLAYHLFFRKKKDGCHTSSSCAGCHEADGCDSCSKMDPQELKEALRKQLHP